ncbi:conserved hypothetical protein [[Clostridium] ultunense Esp]|nr:conserved hypothetical protein [[Clostridium] ultunense Esp]
MKVVLFTDTYRPEVNGVAMTLGRLADYLKEKSFSVKVVAPLPSMIGRDEPHVFRSYSLPFFPYPEVRVAIPNPFTLQKELREFAPDLCHIATPFNLGLTGLHFCKKNRTPVVASYHTHFDRYLPYYNLSILKNGLWAYVKWFYSQAEKIYAPSRETEKLLREHGLNSIEIWPRGIDVSFFRPKEKGEASPLPPAHGKLTLLYVGRLAPEKDLSILMEAYESLPPHIKRRVRLVLVGDGPMAKELREKADDSVLFTGFQQGEELARFYRFADLFTFPSSTETYGNVILEAFASGLPVLAVNQGGVKENVRHGETGWLVRPRDVDAFRQGIITLVEDAPLRERLSRQALFYAKRQSWENVFSNLIRSYQEVLQKREQISIHA